MAPKSKAKAAAKDTLPTDIVKKLCATLKYHEEEPGMKELQAAYKHGDHAKKRDILQRYLQDRSLKWRFDVVETQKMLHTEGSEVQHQWKTAAAIAASEGLNPDVETDQQKLKILLADMQERDHPNAKLQAMGVKQYKEKTELEKGFDGQESSTAFVGTVTGKLVPKSAQDASSSSAAATKAPKRKAQEVLVEVNWGQAMKREKAAGRKAVSAANKICKLAQKNRGACPLEKRDELTTAMRMVEDAEWAMKDSMKNLEDTEEGCVRLKEMVVKMNNTVEIFETLLYDLVPDCKPNEKAMDAEEKTDEKAEEKTNEKTDEKAKD